MVDEETKKKEDYGTWIYRSSKGHKSRWHPVLKSSGHGGPMFPNSVKISDEMLSEEEWRNIVTIYQKIRSVSESIPEAEGLKSGNILSLRHSLFKIVRALHGYDVDYEDILHVVSRACWKEKAEDMSDMDVVISIADGTL